jgi:hypothetical protein
MESEARQEYWGAPCRSCGRMIAFAKVRYEPAPSGNRIIPEPKPHPFVEECPHCHVEAAYSTHEMVLFEGPASLNFHDHPAFLKY